jgi:hypothetical protein
MVLEDGVITIINGGLLPYFTIEDACLLRLINKEFNEVVTKYPWNDMKTKIKGSIKLWKKCFPYARSANVHNKILYDSDFNYFEGLEKLDISRSISNENPIYVTEVGFMKLYKLKLLKMLDCRTIPEIALKYLINIKELDISWCDQITDNIFRYFSKLDKLVMRWCSQPSITDNAFKNITKIKSLDMTGCNQVTISNNAFIYFMCLTNLDMSGCYQETITVDVFKYIKNINELDISCCDQLIA